MKKTNKILAFMLALFLLATPILTGCGLGDLEGASTTAAATQGGTATEPPSSTPNYGITQEEVSLRVGKSRSAVANSIRLLDLPGEVLAMVAARDISAGHARTLLGLKDKEIIVDTAHKILIRSLSVRDTEALVKKLNKIYEASLKGEDEKEVDDDLIVDYIKDLERKAMSLTGKQIKIQNKGKCRLVQIEYVDNEDLEDILVKLCGNKITEE